MFLSQSNQTINLNWVIIRSIYNLSIRKSNYFSKYLVPKTIFKKSGLKSMPHYSHAKISDNGEIPTNSITKKRFLTNNMVFPYLLVLMFFILITIVVLAIITLILESFISSSIVLGFIDSILLAIITAGINIPLTNRIFYRIAKYLNERPKKLTTIEIHEK